MDTDRDDALAAAVVQIVRDVLADAVRGAYLHGSAVLGGLRPTSDLDMLVVIDRPTTPDERAAIVKRLLEVSGHGATNGPARPVELMVVQQAQLRPWHPAPVVDLDYGEGQRLQLEQGEIPDPKPMADFAPEVVHTLAGQRALFGPPPSELIDPVPEVDLRRAIVAGIPSLLGDLDQDQRNVLLTLARILATLETGEILPKPAAAELVAHRLPPASRELLLRASQMYLDGVSDEDAGATWAELRPIAREAAVELVSEIAGFALD